MSILGNRVARSEDPRFITGRATFGEDVELEGAVHVTFVRSFLPHARIRSIDTSAVAAIPGAQAFTAQDVDLAPLPPGFPASTRT
jgi:carbon-monoxide dehydrogenase large subunit